MTTQTTELPQVGIPVTAFPPVLPQIVITESDEPPFAVDCLELRYWSIIPRVGEWASWADYSLPDWKLTEAKEVRTLRPAKVHNVQGVEIKVRTWKSEGGWQPDGTMHALLTERTARWLAVNLVYEEESQVETFLDEHFDWNWGETDRFLEDQGAVGREPDGSLRVRDRDAVARGTGAGVFTIDIGGKQIICLRVFEGDLENEIDTLVESYLTRQGRTVLVRRYKRPSFVQKAMFEVTLDETMQIVADGKTFVHWYDTITNFAL